MIIQEHLVERVSNDPNRESMEKETGITMLGDAKEMRVFSAKRALIVRLIKHPHFDPEWYSVEGSRVDPSEIADTQGDIWAVSGKMPIGCLTIKSKPRSTNYQSQVVNFEGVPEDAFQ